MSQFCIHRPVFAIVMALLIVIVGGVAIIALPVAQFPPISPPTIQVTTSYPGASADVVEDAVANVIENQMVGVDHMIYMQSTSTSNGQYTLNCTFDVGSSTEQALIDVQNRINQVQQTLPNAVNVNGITVQKKSPQILMVVNLYSPSNSYDALFLSNYATLNIINPLQSVQGIGSYSVLGQFNYAMRAWLNPDKLAQSGIQASDVSDAIQSSNVLNPTGALGMLPAPNTTKFQTSITSQSQLQTAKEFGNVIVRTNPDGSVLRVTDVGRTELGAQQYQTVGAFNNAPSTVILLYQTPDANALATAKNVRKTMAALKAQFPAGLDYAIPYDSTVFVKDSLKDVVKTLFEAIVLVIIVVFVFLGSFRASFIPMLAIPVSLIGSFAAFFALGFSINTLTLLGLVLAIGLVVDDAIVVVEAVEKHIEEGLAPVQAAEAAMGELQRVIVGIGLVLVSVFLPAAFISGIVGQLYKQFAMTLAISVSISAFVALTLTPALCVLILKRAGPKPAALSWFNSRFDAVFNRVRSFYMSILGRFIVVPAIVMLCVFGVYGLDAFLGLRLPSGFVPLEDQGVVFVQLNLPYGSSLNRTAADTQRLVNDIKKIKGVESVVTLGGFNLINSFVTPDCSALIVTLIPWDERPISNKELGIKNIALEIYKRIQAYPDVAGFPFVPPTIPGLGQSSGYNFELQDVGSHTVKQLGIVADKLQAASLKDPVISHPMNSMRFSTPRIELDVDRDKAHSFGVQPSTIFKNLGTLLGSSFVNYFTLFNRTWNVMLQADDAYRIDPNNLNSIWVKNDSGNVVPLAGMVSTHRTVGPDMIQHFNANREVEFTGSNADGYSSGQAIAAMQKIAKETIPKGYTYGWSATSYQQVAAGNTQIYIFIFSIIIVFLVLAALYESWIMPLAVLMGVVFGLLGALLSVTLWRLDLNVYVQIGFLMMIGLEAKNAILIVEFALDREREGMTSREAAIAASNLRFRPILMTSFAFIFGVLPLMLASGAGAASRHSIGATVFGGMITATLFGDLVIPTLYEVARGIIARGKARTQPPMPGQPALAHGEA